MRSILNHDLMVSPDWWWRSKMPCLKKCFVLNGCYEQFQLFLSKETSLQSEKSPRSKQNDSYLIAPNAINNYAICLDSTSPFRDNWLLTCDISSCSKYLFETYSWARVRGRDFWDFTWFRFFTAFFSVRNTTFVFTKIYDQNLWDFILRYILTMLGVDTGSRALYRRAKCWLAAVQNN